MTDSITTTFIEPNALFRAEPNTFLSRIAPASTALVLFDPPWSHLAGLAYQSAPEPRRKGLELAYFRLLAQLARRALRPDGSLLVMTSGLEPYVQVILDELFGVDNALGQYVWPLRVITNVAPRPTAILHYVVDRKQYKRELKRPMTEQEILRRFTYSDDKGSYQRSSLLWTQPRNRDTWRGFSPPEGKSWRLSPSQLEKLFNEGRIEFVRDVPYLKRYASEYGSIAIGAIWDDINPITKKIELDGLTGYAKPLDLCKRMLDITSDPEDVVVEPFCGSGSLVIAAQQSGRKWLACDIGAGAIDIVRARLSNLDEQVDYKVETLETEVRDYKLDVSLRSIMQRFAEPVDARRRFVLGEEAPVDEGEEMEFKELPHVDFKKNLEIIEKVSEYAVAYLNAGLSGEVIFGIRDKDYIVTGIALNAKERDQVKLLIVDKIKAIEPAVSPQEYKILITCCGEDAAKTKRYVIEFAIQAPKPSADLYFADGHTCYMKNASGRQKLSGVKLSREIQRRLAMVKDSSAHPMDSGSARSGKPRKRRKKSDE